MIVLGLTGSIASGKSTVANMFADAGVPVFSADAAVHELYRNEAFAAVAETFPQAVQAGRVDRRALADIVVADQAKLRRLEAIIHPLVRTRAMDFITAQSAAGATLAVLEIPLLLEAGDPYPVDRVAVTYVADTELRRRALARPGMTRQRLEAVLARQMPQAEKRLRADFEIDTGQPLEAVRKRVAEIIKACRDPFDR